MGRFDITRPSGTAHVEPLAAGWSIDLDPQSELDAATDLLAAALHAVAEHGGGLVRHWVRGGDQVLATASRRLGLGGEREVHQLRRSLPVGEPWELRVRPFVVGQDEAAWLEVNNRAFDWHPEQGGWGLDDLQARLAEPWFDPAGFLLHEEGDRLVGFCWTKAHRDVEPNLGEIYVIAVDPAAGRHGLGRPLTLAGLDHLYRDGLEVAMLYVEGTNDVGMHLYDKLGFIVHHTDRSFTTMVDPSR